MKKHILLFVSAVAGGLIVKGLLLPLLATIMVGGTEGVAGVLLFLSYMVGSICVIEGVVAIASAAAYGDIRRLGWSAVGVIFGVIILLG